MDSDKYRSKTELWIFVSTDSWSSSRWNILITTVYSFLTWSPKEETFQKFPQDLPEDSPDDLVHHDLKTWRTRQDSGGLFSQSRSTGYGKMCNVDLGLLVVTDQKSGNRPHPLANIKRTRRSLVYINPILKQSTPPTGRRVLLFGGLNQYKLVVFSVFCVLVCDLLVLSLRLLPAEQINHRD
jgi:hypothetical protein